MKKEEAKKEKEQIEIQISQLQQKRTELQAVIDAPEITKEQRFLELLNGCEIKIDKEKYPGSVFFFKGDKYFFEIEKAIIWCSLENVWKIFYDEFSLDYTATQALIKHPGMEEHFKCKGLTPILRLLNHQNQVEEHFKCKGLTPAALIRRSRKEVEEHFKCKGLTPAT